MTPNAWPANSLVAKSEEHRKLGFHGRAVALHVGRRVFDEALGQGGAPIGAGAALVLAPGHRLPIRRGHQEAAGVNFDAVAAGLVAVEIEPLRIVMLRRPR